MNTSWGWIKQRPHFLAEGLSDIYDVTVLTKKSKHNSSSDNNSVICKTLYRIPFERISVISAINRILYGFQFKRYAKKADIIWIASPSDFSFAYESCESKLVIYDCMDDQIELQKTQRLKKSTAFWENRLFKRADIVIASSQYLASVLNRRYGEKRIVVVNNAIKNDFGKELSSVSQPAVAYNQDYIHISYIGTISTWMNFDLIKALIDYLPRIVFHLYGPLDCKTYPVHERIIFHGKVSHDQVNSIMEASDILIMPFVVNELIKSVNPVKLYEYVYTGKPCLAPLYGESLQFEEYVYLYKDCNDCIEQVKQLILNGYKPKKSLEECRAFAKNNTWSARVKVINNTIINYIK